MGLGKIIQAIVVVELYCCELGIGSVFIICFIFFKYQWCLEIECFIGIQVYVVEGFVYKCWEQYDDYEQVYKILIYNVVVWDYFYLNVVVLDFVILDEVQCIKNWDIKIFWVVKCLEVFYWMVLIGIFFENKLEDLYFIIQFLD